MVNFCKSEKCLVGKTAIVTGANTGIGFQTALDFAKRGGRVILACRSLERAKRAREQIIQKTGNHNIVVKLLNLEHLQSVRNFAKDINEHEEKLNILINNGGLGYIEHRYTRDGLQNVMAINYFSHFLLTNLLLDLLIKSAPSRIVNVASSNAKYMSPEMKVEEINQYKGSNRTYGMSKLCQIYFTQELAKRLEGTGVTVYSVHPGAVRTEFQRFSRILGYAASVFFRSAQEGAQTVLHAALQSGVEKFSGRHFYDCLVVEDYHTARDAELRRQLWEKTEELVGLKPKNSTP